MNFIKGKLKMKLYLVQHAKAASKEVDPERSLTEEGLRELKKVAAFIKPLNLSIDYLWHSGKKRARQTADILAEVITISEEHAARDGLAPNDDVKTIENQIMSLKQDIMIVGHLPFLSKLASLLLTGSDSSETVAFRNAGIVCLNHTDNQWQLDWMITPEILG
jgi:phosphohistidine phosphatase